MRSANSIAMHHSRSYPVSAVKVSLPQPHVSCSSKSSSASASNDPVCCGWIVYLFAGIIAGTFLVCIIVLGGQRVFLVAIDPSADLVPTIKQGSFQVYPFLVKSDFGIESRYFSHLPPRNLSQIVNSLDALFQAYPKRHEPTYRNCWLETPTDESPCFFDASWLSDVCTRQDSYGYEERDGHFSPCFVMRLEQTGDWNPRFMNQIPRAVSDHYDPGFSPVHCFAKAPQLQPNITIYPPKGFSRLFFPASRFNPNKYLMPMVAVKLHRIPKGRNLTVECSVVIPNAFFLRNNGKAVMRFEAP